MTRVTTHLFIAFIYHAFSGLVKSIINILCIDHIKLNYINVYLQGDLLLNHNSKIVEFFIYVSIDGHGIRLVFSWRLCETYMYILPCMYKCNIWKRIVVNYKKI